MKYILTFTNLAVLAIITWYVVSINFSISDINHATNLIQTQCWVNK